MKIHILGVCGTFMAGIAVLAKRKGFQVQGSDQGIYPPMDQQLRDAGIVICDPFEPSELSNVDLVIVGNAMSRGNPEIEYLLNNNIPFMSGPEWLSRYVLRSKKVLAVAGTHGKTTTSSMLTWILYSAGLDPSFLIGGVPRNFDVSACLTQSPYFVIEADEYDSAFFDKRAKFVHYFPHVLILNNLEFDHADIYDDLDAIKRQLHHLVRTLPSEGLIIRNNEEKELQAVLDQGCWTKVQSFGNKGDWSLGTNNEIIHNEHIYSPLKWDVFGRFNQMNALAAIAAASYIGVPVEKSIEALSTFQNVKRRLECIGTVNNIKLYDDFAHHPTAIKQTLKALREEIGKKRLVVILELASYTMRHSVHKNTLAHALAEADLVYVEGSQASWNVNDLTKVMSKPCEVHKQASSIIQSVKKRVKPGDHIIIMSNRGFSGLHQSLLQELDETMLI